MGNVFLKVKWTVSGQTEKYYVSLASDNRFRLSPKCNKHASDRIAKEISKAGNNKTAEQCGDKTKKLILNIRLNMHSVHQELGGRTGPFVTKWMQSLRRGMQQSHPFY